MPLVKCKECAKEVSSTAAACPGCGAPIKPAKSAKKTSGCAWIVLIFIAIPFLAGVFGLIGNEDSSQAPALSETDCKARLQCWGDRHSGAALGPCTRAVEAQAKFQAEWTDGMLEQKFPRFAWVDPEGGSLQYVGDKVKFQNGFGAWQHMEYRCVFDPGTGQATAVATPR